MYGFTGKKNSETDGYNAIQVGFYNLKEKQVNKPARGHFKKANAEPLRYIREFRVKDIDASRDWSGNKS